MPRIEHTTRRQGGSLFTMPSGIEYHFKPRAEDDPRHVDDVADDGDFALFLDAGRQTGTFKIAADPRDSVAPAENGEDDATSGADDESPASEAGPDQDGVPSGPAEDLTALDEEQLRTRFASSVGRPASKKAGKETMIAQIIEAETGSSE